ncbi:hypothetical protein ARD30_19955 [Bosea thiooxidans]|uniref:Uncharacterized protein n=2 Tax=Bosea thiooxidans TaxID=53254 RepID=A0A0Q3KHA2_9HYPH|nr:hypothetical protein ARD30_19955 [Bosea thiooxidans]
MLTISHVIAMQDIVQEVIRIETEFLKGSFPDNSQDFLDYAVHSLIYDIVSRAKGHGIEVLSTGPFWSDHAEEWEPGDPIEAEVRFCFPDDANAVLFRTMFI